MQRILLFTAILCCFMLISNGQEIVNITVKPNILLPENGLQNKVSVLFNHIDVPDQINCWVKCDDGIEVKIAPNPDYGNKLSCIYYVDKDVSEAKNCSMDMNLTSSIELLLEQPITFFIRKPVSVDRNALFVDVGNDAIVTVIDGKYPDPVICDFVKQDGSQDGHFKQTDCEMSIHDVGFVDAGLYNFTICLPGSSEDGCVKGQKEVIVWKCFYDKMSNSVMVNITSADDGIHVQCVNGCSNIAESVITENDGIRSFVWSNVTTTPHIKGAYSGRVFLNASCMNTVKGHISGPQSETSSSVIVWIIVAIGFVVAAAVIVVILIRTGKLKLSSLPCFNGGGEADNSRRELKGDEEGEDGEELHPLSTMKDGTEKNGHAV